MYITHGCLSTWQQKTENYNLTLKPENGKIRWLLIITNIYMHIKRYYEAWKCFPLFYFILFYFFLEMFFLSHSYIKVLQDKGENNLPMFQSIWKWQIRKASIRIYIFICPNKGDPNYYIFFLASMFFLMTNKITQLYSSQFHN